MPRAKIPTDKRLKDIEALAPEYKNKTEFLKDNPYLYRWAKEHDVDLNQYFPKKPIHCHVYEKTNSGIDVYKVGSKKLYKHYPFVIDALRDLDLTYYFVNRVLDGTIPSVNGYTFVKCS